MKRAWMLGVMAALIAAGTLFTAPAAQAKITCTITNLNGPGGYNITWPFTTDVTACTGTTLQGLNSTQGGLWTVVFDYKYEGPVLQARKPRVFLFNKPSDFNTYFNVTGTKCEAPNVTAVSYFSGCLISGRPFTAVFANFMQQNRLVQNQYIAHTAAHEMGHWFDRLILGTPTAPYSSSPIWTHEMMGTGTKGDYPTFNALQYACMGADVFNGLMDNYVPSSYICDNNGSGPGLSERYKSYAKSTNTTLLNAAVRHYYSVPTELFAEETAVDVGFSEDVNVDAYLVPSNQWNCTQTLARSMLNYGAPPGIPPSPYQVPSNCPAK